MNVHIAGPDSALALDGYEVWLEEGPLIFHGVCIGAGDTEEAAIRDARTTLQQMTRDLDAKFESCSSR